MSDNQLTITTKIDDSSELRERNKYYIDKTMMIAEDLQLWKLSMLIR